MLFFRAYYSSMWGCELITLEQHDDDEDDKNKKAKMTSRKESDQQQQARKSTQRKEGHALRLNMRKHNRR